MLKICPFTYSLQIQQVYDSGTVFNPRFWTSMMMTSVHNSFRVLMLPPCPWLSVTPPSAPHSITNSFKNQLAIAVATDISFKEAEEMKVILADPASLPASCLLHLLQPLLLQKKKKEETTKEESEEESDNNMGFELFD